ncbi:MAG: RICIN domain-containing protein [Polyangia bacterium]
MGIHENQHGSGADRLHTRAAAGTSAQNGEATAAVLGGALDRLAAILAEQGGGRAAAAPAGGSGLQPVLFIKWQSALSDAAGESFLAAASDGSVAIVEGTPQQPGGVLWSSQPQRGAAPAAAPAQAPAPAAPAVSAAPQAAPAPAAAPRRGPVQEVFITSRTTGKRLAIDGARTDSSARLVLQAPNGGAHQRFFATIHEGGYTLRAAQSPFVVNAALGRSDKGQAWQLIEIASHNSDDPGLAIEETAEGDYRIRAPQSGRWLATAQVNGNEVPVLDASQGQEQASRWLIHAAPATPRLAVLDLQSVAPRPKTDGALDVVLPAGQLPCVDALPGSPFRAFTGDFLKRGRDQLLLVRPDSKYHHVDLLEFADGTARSLASAVLEPGSWIDGWLGPNDLQLVGNLSGHGSSQLLLLHRGQRRPGEQAVLLSLQNGLEAPRKLYADNWGERQWLDGWLDPNDVHMVGDFMGLGYDQWMMMNRNPRGGRVRIVDIKGGTPRRCYTEMWGQSPLLDGWMDEGRIMLAGDFLKRGHMQVLFINRNIAFNTGKILIADFCRAAPPAEVCYRELWGQSDLVNDFIADSDVQVAGDFMGRGYAQVLFVSRKGEGEKFLVADFHRGAPPAEACVREQWGQRARNESLVHPGSVVLAGKFRRSGSSQGAAQVILL